MGLTKLYILRLGFGDKSNSLNTEKVYDSPAKRDQAFEEYKKQLGSAVVDDNFLNSTDAIATSLPLLYITKTEGFRREME